MDKLKGDIEVIKASGLFDSSWYASEYQDVAQLGLDPIEHYLRFGARLLRNPSPKFDTHSYLISNPDVAAAGLNPLAHYASCVVKEGRALLPTVKSSTQYSEQIDIVLPVFNALEEVKKCVESTRTRRDGFSVRTIIVNDGSDTATTIWLREYCHAHNMFELIEHSVNQGYTKAVNTGLKATTAPYVIILNSDTIVTHGWLKGLVRCIKSTPRVGVVGPLSNAASWQNVPYLYDGAGQFAINEIPPGMSPNDMAGIVAAESKRTYPHIPFVNGFCFMIKRQVIDAIGLMDEDNFPIGYGEENDYCIRAADAGFKLAIADDAYVFHAKSKSFGHEKRQELSRDGAEALKRKHTIPKLNILLNQVKDTTPQLDLVREAVKTKLRRRQLRCEVGDIVSMRILFLLPVDGGGGGAHSVVQEASEMRTLGIKACVAVYNVEEFLNLYCDFPRAEELFAELNPSNILELAKDYDVVIGTIFSSMELLKKVVEYHPHILPLYYVQDYEPLFFPENSPHWKIARDSYSLVPQATLFAKTRWIVDKVRVNHGLHVHKVEPGIDHNLYKPRLRREDGLLHIAAMIRPQTPRRGAERTMSVLSRVARAHKDRVVFHLFGCRDGNAQFHSLPRDFEYTNHGILKRPEVAALLAQSDIFVDLSDYQAFGRTALEAMSCGCAAVVPDHGGSDEYAIDGINALVVDSLNEEECFEKVSWLIGDRETLRRLQVEGILKASKFTIRSAVLSELAVISEAYEKTVRRKPGQIPDGCEPVPRTSLAATRQNKLAITALIVTWDVGHNPLGRSYMLAEVLDRIVHNVVLVGFQFPRYGDEVWEPLRNGRIPVIALPGKDLPEFIDSLEAIAERVQPDIVIACKSRLPSIQLAAMIKHKINCPLVLDIDDHELSFFNTAEEIAINDLAGMKVGELSRHVEPYGEVWTRLAQNMRKFADEIIVSNITIKEEFGGTCVPHVRDETIFDPNLYSRAASRRKYDIPLEAKVVLFFGTPRHHKGINLLAEAVNRIDDPAFKLVVVGSTTDRSVTAKLEQLAPGCIIHLPNQPFSSIPEILAFADVVCLPQDETSQVAKYQLPAKAIDAVAMGVPLLVTKTPPLMQLVYDGVAVAVSLPDLSSALKAMANNRAAQNEWAARVRPLFLARYSYAAASELLRKVVLSALQNNDKGKVDELPMLLSHQRKVLGVSSSSRKVTPGPGIDIVIFWKQNDTGIYGRRSDMIIRYLASREDVRRVIVLDAPISEHDLINRRKNMAETTHYRLVYIKTYEKLFGKLDSGKVSFHVFVYPPEVYRNTEEGTARPKLLDAYNAYLSRVFVQAGVSPSEAVFWIYPKNFMAPGLIDYFLPKRIVVDVVDDHRAWPGVSVIERERLTENYRDILSRAHMVFVNCEPMVKAMREFFPAVRMVPNGCDPEPPRGKPRKNLEFEAFLAGGGKTIGFIGNLEQKIDIPLIAKVAERFRDSQIVLLGSTHANSKVLQLKNYTNVRMPGIVPYDEIGAWLSRIDVGIIPHLDIEMTRRMNPLKLYVYLSWRVPVVSTEIYNLDSSSRFVRVAHTHDEFLDHVAAAMGEGKIMGQDLERFIEENSWASRFRCHVDELLAPLKERTCE